MKNQIIHVIIRGRRSTLMSIGQADSREMRLLRYCWGSLQDRWKPLFFFFPRPSLSAAGSVSVPRYAYYVRCQVEEHPHHFPMASNEDDKSYLFFALLRHQSIVRLFNWTRYSRSKRGNYVLFFFLTAFIIIIVLVFFFSLSIGTTTFTYWCSTLISHRCNFYQVQSCSRKKKDFFTYKPVL